MEEDAAGKGGGGRRTGGGMPAPASASARRYDRQLRLWGDAGQVALENSHVCLINASAVGMGDATRRDGWERPPTPSRARDRARR